MTRTTHNKAQTLALAGLLTDLGERVQTFRNYPDLAEYATRELKFPVSGPQLSYLIKATGFKYAPAHATAWRVNRERAAAAAKPRISERTLEDRIALLEERVARLEAVAYLETLA